MLRGGFDDGEDELVLAGDAAGLRSLEAALRAGSGASLALDGSGGLTGAKPLDRLDVVAGTGPIRVGVAGGRVTLAGGRNSRRALADAVGAFLADGVDAPGAHMQLEPDEGAVLARGSTRVRVGGPTPDVGPSR